MEREKQSAKSAPYPKTRQQDTSGGVAAPGTTSVKNPANAAGQKFFTTADAGAGFCADYLSDVSCRQWVLARIHPGDPCCPACGRIINDITTISNFHEGLRCRCSHCGHWFTARTGTILHGSQLTWSQVYLLAVLIYMGIDVKRIAAAVGISTVTVHIWIKRFKAFKG